MHPDEYVLPFVQRVALLVDADMMCCAWHLQDSLHRKHLPDLSRVWLVNAGLKWQLTVVWQLLCCLSSGPEQGPCGDKQGIPLHRLGQPDMSGFSAPNERRVKNGGSQPGGCTARHVLLGYLRGACVDPHRLALTVAHSSKAT